MFIPVMPRILDPSLKFTEESILTSLEKSTANFQKSRDKSVENNTVVEIKEAGTEQASKKSFITIISKYKSYIFIILGLVVLVALLYLLYTKKFKSKETKKVDTGDGKEEQPTAVEKEKVDKISNYLSNYIDTASECSSSDTKENNIEVEDIDTMVPPTLVSIQEEEEQSSVTSDDDNKSNNVDEEYDFESDTDEKITILEEEEIQPKVIVEYMEGDGDEEDSDEVDVLLTEAEDPVDIFKKYTQAI